MSQRSLALEDFHLGLPVPLGLELEDLPSPRCQRRLCQREFHTHTSSLPQPKTHSKVM